MKEGFDGEQGQGWQAGLSLQLAIRGEKSVVALSRQRGPLTIQQPFYPEGDELCHLYLLHPPAGIVGGDSLLFDVEVQRGAHGLITTPGATKFYRSNGKRASQQQHFTIGSGASLEWFPQETIYFPNTFAQLQSRVDMQDGALFMGWEVHCLGLPVNGKNLEEGRVKTGWRIYREGKPLLLEAMEVVPEKRGHRDAFLRNYPVVASFIVSGADDTLVQEVRALLSSSPFVSDNSREASVYGVTLVADLLIIRYLGNSVREVYGFFLPAWQLLRPFLLQRKACAPRIWAT